MMLGAWPREENDCVPNPCPSSGIGVQSPSLCKYRTCIFFPSMPNILCSLLDFSPSFWAGTSHSSDANPASSLLGEHLPICQGGTSHALGAQPPSSPAPSSRESPGNPGRLPACLTVCFRHVAVPCGARPTPGGLLAGFRPLPHAGFSPQANRSKPARNCNAGPGMGKLSSGGQFGCQGNLLSPAS